MMFVMMIVMMFVMVITIMTIMTMMMFDDGDCDDVYDGDHDCRNHDYGDLMMFVMVITIFYDDDDVCDGDDFLGDDVCDGDHDFLGDDDITSKKLSTLR